MLLTEEGKTLLRYCNQTQGLEAQLKANLNKSDSNTSVDINIVGPSMILGHTVTKNCQQLAQQWKNLNLSFNSMSSVERKRRLKESTADLAVLLEKDLAPELDYKEMKPWEFALVAPYAWKGRSLKSILEKEKLCTYHNEDQTAFDYLSKFQLETDTPLKRVYSNDNLVKKNMILNSLAYGILPPAIIEQEIKEKKLILLNGKKTIKIPIFLAWYKREKIPDYLQAIIDCID